MTKRTSVAKRWERMLKHVKSIWRGEQTAREGDDLEEIALANENQGIALGKVSSAEDEHKVRLQLWGVASQFYCLGVSN